MKNVLIVDTETTGVDREKDHVIELGCILWNVEHRCAVELYSRLLPAESNAAEAINGIPAALLSTLKDAGTWDGFAELTDEAEACVAHQADFDRAFVERHVAIEMPWICTREDMRWPRAGTGESLIATALAHGVAVVSAHRAISDCLLIARLFETVPDIDVRLEAALAHALLPKARLVSLAPYEEREIVKASGFKWDPQRKEWWRRMSLRDSEALPFKTRIVEL
jgi:DNA polymerase III subunit epsilon